MTYRFGAIRPLLSPEERRILRRGKQAMKRGNYGEAVMLFDSLMELEPRYKPVRQLIKTAMKGNERQEKQAKGMSNFKYAERLNPKQLTDNNPGEIDELEQLLNLGNEHQAKAAKPATKGEKL